MKPMTLSKAAEVVGVPQPTVSRWVKQGLIQPPEGYACTHGKKVPFGAKELRELTILAQLREVLSFQALRKAAEYLRSLGHNPFSTGDFFVVQETPDEPRLLKLCSEGELIELIGERQGQMQLFKIGPDPLPDALEDTS